VRSILRQYDRLLLLTYETLIANPQPAFSAVYNFGPRKAVRTTLRQCRLCVVRFDRRLGTPGLHAF
jgi:hypothetical protein